MFKKMLDKVKVWWNNKQEEVYPLNEAPDENEDTAREVVHADPVETATPTPG